MKTVTTVTTVTTAMLKHLQRVGRQHAGWVASIHVSFHFSRADAIPEALVERVEQLGRKWPTPKDKGHPAHALCKRLLRHSDELFEFVLQPGLASDNNLAERSIRPLVIACNISGGTHSQRGSNTRMDLQTLFATWAAQGKSALDACLALLTTYRPSPCTPLP